MNDRYESRLLVEESQYKRAWAFIGITLVIVIILGLAYYAVTHELLDMKCPIYELTGYSCPGCGITRMTTSILHMEIEQAYKYNPFLFISLPFAIVFYCLLGKSYIQSGEVGWKYEKILMWWVVLLLLYGVLRNIPELQPWLSPMSIT